MDPLVQMLVVGVATFLASSGGFWVFLKSRQEKKDANTALLMGLAHDKIVYFGMKYIEKGFVTKDEYDALIRYFYEPYMALGGDGTAERIMGMVQKLPMSIDQKHFIDAIEKGSENVIKKVKEEGENFERRERPR